ncbi:hypothetical protein F4680DRAFT_407305, partial [Xylaria scruposa]
MPTSVRVIRPKHTNISLDLSLSGQGSSSAVTGAFSRGPHRSDPNMLPHISFFFFSICPLIYLLRTGKDYWLINLLTACCLPSRWIIAARTNPIGGGI